MVYGDGRVDYITDNNQRYTKGCVSQQLCLEVVQMEPFGTAIGITGYDHKGIVPLMSVFSGLFFCAHINLRLNTLF